MCTINLSPFPKLYTDRLVLRELTEEDVNEIFMLRSDDIVNKYLNRKKASDLNDALLFIQMIRKNVSENVSSYWAISLKENPSLIGTITLWSFDLQACKGEIGYELLPQFWGKGIITEAMQKVLEFGFVTMQLNEIDAYTHPSNDASSKVLDKHGFKKTATSEWGEIIYTLAAKDFI